MAAGQDGNAKHKVPSAPPKGPIEDGRRLRVAIIGTGGMGGGHLSSMLGQRDAKEEAFDVVALCDVNKKWLDEKLAKARTRQPGVQVDGYRDYHDLLAREDIDCVLIAAPEHWHATMAVDAIAAGKDVYCEKPMTLSIEEALWLRTTMHQNPHMRLQVGTQYMMLKKYHKAKELIAEGVIGTPTLSQTSYCRNSLKGEWLYHIHPEVVPGEMLDWERWCGPLGPAEFDTEIYHRWRRYKKYSTGVIGDLLVHMMTPMMFALDRGWPTRVTASGGHYVDQTMENHDQVFLTVEFEKSHTMIVAGSTANEKGLETMIRGHQGNLYLGSNDCVLRPERHWVDDIDAETFECPKVHEQPALRLNWLQCVRSREQNVSQVDLATQVMIIVDLATRSMWTGKAWVFDPETLTASPA
ncbi:MAG: putative dehydrogenase [Planctomycetota bacterium]|jgi:predicted dehydrogenase